jgi:hypothetical protein
MMSGYTNFLLGFSPHTRKFLKASQFQQRYRFRADALGRNRIGHWSQYRPRLCIVNNVVAPTSKSVGTEPTTRVAVDDCLLGDYINSRKTPKKWAPAGGSGAGLGGGRDKRFAKLVSFYVLPTYLVPFSITGSFVRRTRASRGT